MDLERLPIFPVIADSTDRSRREQSDVSDIAGHKATVVVSASDRRRYRPPAFS